MRDEAEAAHVCSLLRHWAIKKNNFLLRGDETCYAICFISQGILHFL